MYKKSPPKKKDTKALASHGVNSKSHRERKRRRRIVVVVVVAVIAVVVDCESSPSGSTIDSSLCEIRINHAGVWSTRHNPMTRAITPAEWDERIGASTRTIRFLLLLLLLLLMLPFAEDLVIVLVVVEVRTLRIG